MPFAYNLFQPTDDILELDIDMQGHIFSRNQVTDYVCRGEALQQHSVLEFFVNTYEEDLGKEKSAVDSPNLEEDNLERRGRPRHARVRYLPHHPMQSCKLFVDKDTEIYPTVLAGIFLAATIRKCTNFTVHVC